MLETVSQKVSTASDFPFAMVPSVVQLENDRSIDSVPSPVG